MAIAIRSQKGFALLELLVAALLATLLAVWGTQALVNRLDDAGAQANAAWMLTLRQSVQRYLERYAGVLVQLEPSTALAPQYADWTQPTVAELKADALLSEGFPLHTALGGGASVRILREGACPGSDCRINALIHSNTPFLSGRSKRVNEQMVAQWLMASQGWGGWVAPTRLDAIGGAAFRYANPSWSGEPLPAGTVALAIPHEQLHAVDFLRVGDMRDPDFQGTATVRGDISTDADLRATGYMHLGTPESRLASCGQDGAVAREHGGGLLVCRDGFWHPASRGSGAFSINEFWGCQSSDGASTANPITGMCACPARSFAVLVSDSGPLAPPVGRTTGYVCVD